MSQEQDRKFMRNFLGVIAALALAGIIFGILANVLVGIYEPPGNRARELSRLRAERMQPVGRVNVASEPSAVDSAKAPVESTSDDAARSGEQVVEQVCSACHTNGFLNAPQVGSKEDWAPRAKQGLDALAEHALEGFGNMPPQGDVVSETEARAAVKYMVEAKTGITLK